MTAADSGFAGVMLIFALVMIGLIAVGAVAMLGDEEQNMNNIVNLQKYKEENSPHEVAEVICLNCMNRWISVHRQGEWLAKWECPKCSNVGGIIYTGQPLLDER